MEKGFRMRRLLLLSFIVPFFCNAQISSDSVIMTVAGKEISLAEFEYMATKNNEVDLTNKKSLNAYVDLFKNFKLKVADAENLGLDNTNSFQSEYRKYKAELTESYMNDQQGQDAVTKMIYDRGDRVLSLRYILFAFPGVVVSKDTLAVYQKAYSAYERIKAGEDFDKVAERVVKEDSTSQLVFSGKNESLLPLKALKAFDNVAWNMKEGELSIPFRTSAGYYLIQLDKHKPNQGQVRVAHILFRVNDSENEELSSEKLKLANEVRERLLSGESFEELAKEFSEDEGNAGKGGVLPFFSHGVMVPEFELAAFNLKEKGAVSSPVKTAFGYHLIKLIDKKPRSSYEEEKDRIASVMRKDEWNFEFYNSFDTRLKKEYGYTFYPEAYAKLERVCDSYFPTDSMFFKQLKDEQDTLAIINNRVIDLTEFCYYLYRNPFSTKTYSKDFMQEVYDLFLRDVVKAHERENLETKHPEYLHLLQEYRDGILLFEVSNARVWQKPIEEQPELERKWMAEIQKKYPVVVNTKLLKKIKKH